MCGSLPPPTGHPEASIKSQHLREDLYYRLNVFHIPLPALRDHKQDIPAIVEALIVDLNKKHTCRVTDLHPESLERLESHHWPGNVRELRNVVERAVVLTGEGTILPQSLRLGAAGCCASRDHPYGCRQGSQCSGWRPDQRRRESLYPANVETHQK